MSDQTGGPGSMDKKSKWYDETMIGNLTKLFVETREMFPKADLKFEWKAKGFTCFSINFDEKIITQDKNGKQE